MKPEEEVQKVEVNHEFTVEQREDLIINDQQQMQLAFSKFIQEHIIFNQKLEKVQIESKRIKEVPEFISQGIKEALIESKILVDTLLSFDDQIK